MKARRKKRQTRRIHFGTEVWTWQSGARFVSIRDPDGNRTVVLASEISGGSWQTPQAVKDYIWRVMRPGKMIDNPTSEAQAKDMAINLFTGARK